MKRIGRTIGIVILGIWLFIHCIVGLPYGPMVLLESFLTPTFVLPLIGLIALIRWNPKPKWYKLLPHHMRPDGNKIKKLEALRKSLDLPHDIFFMRIGGSRWAVIKAQEATLEQAKKAMPNATDKELWWSILLSRFEVELNFPSPWSPPPDKILNRMENIDTIIAHINSFEELVDYVVGMEEADLFDPSGIQNEIDQVLLEKVAPLPRSKQVDKSTGRERKQFFDITFACDLMRKPSAQVLQQCAAFNASFLTEDELDNYRVDEYYGPFDAIIVQFFCNFMLRDYQAFSTVTIRFTENKAVECVISLGKPANFKRYRSELEVTKKFLLSLEELYHNGRIQEEDELGTKVYKWKKDNRTEVSFVSHTPSYSSTDTGAFLSVQIRDTQLHPQGRELEFFYNEARKL